MITLLAKTYIIAAIRLIPGYLNTSIEKGKTLGKAKGTSHLTEPATNAILAIGDKSEPLLCSHY